MTTRVIQFTQEQVRHLTGITPGDLRHWRKCIPYLAAKAGKSARFSFADVLGLALVAESVRRYGINVAYIGDGLEALFRVLVDARPSQLERALVVVTPRRAELMDRDELGGRQLGEASLVVPCAPLLAKLRNGLVPIPAPEQTSLAFPPQIVRSGQ